MLETLADLVNAFVFPYLGALGIYCAVVNGAGIFGAINVRVVHVTQQEPQSWQPQSQNPEKS